MAKATLITDGPVSLACGDVCRFSIRQEKPGAKLCERIRIHTVNKSVRGVEFTGLLVTEGVLLPTNIKGFYNTKDRTGQMTYEPEDLFSDLVNGSL